METILAPGLKSRMLGLSGWFSTNILGNRDGEVFDPESFKTKEESSFPCSTAFSSRSFTGSLWGFPSQGPDPLLSAARRQYKEGWDNIDIFGWLGYPMQIKINFLCRDSSILAAPLVLDLVLFSTWQNAAG